MHNVHLTPTHPRSRTGFWRSRRSSRRSRRAWVARRFQKLSPGFGLGSFVSWRGRPACRPPHSPAADRRPLTPRPSGLVLAPSPSHYPCLDRVLARPLHPPSPHHHAPCPRPPPGPALALIWYRLHPLRQHAAGAQQPDDGGDGHHHGRRRVPCATLPPPIARVVRGEGRLIPVRRGREVGLGEAWGRRGRGGGEAGWVLDEGREATRGGGGEGRGEEGEGEGAVLLLPRATPPLPPPRGLRGDTPCALMHEPCTRLPSLTLTPTLTRMCIAYAIKNLALGTSKYNIDPDSETPVRALP